MLERIVRFSIEHRMLLVLLTIAAAALGGYTLQYLPIDAVPDITNKQVQVNTVAPALSPVEIEKQGDVVRILDLEPHHSKLPSRPHITGAKTRRLFINSLARYLLRAGTTLAPGLSS